MLLLVASPAIWSIFSRGSLAVNSFSWIPWLFLIFLRTFVSLLICFDDSCVFFWYSMFHLSHNSLSSSPWLRSWVLSEFEKIVNVFHVDNDWHFFKVRIVFLNYLLCLIFIFQRVREEESDGRRWGFWLTRLLNWIDRVLSVIYTIDIS